MYMPETKGMMLYMYTHTCFVTFIVFLTLIDVCMCASVHSGLIPLHNACSYGHFEVAELLVKVSALSHDGHVIANVFIIVSTTCMCMFLTVQCKCQCC